MRKTWNTLYTKVVAQHRFSDIFPHPRDVALSRDAWSLFASPGYTTFRSRVNATPVENSIIAATIYARAGSRTTNAHSSLKWKRAPSSSLPCRWRAKCMSRTGVVFISDAIFAPCAIGLWCRLIYSDRKKMTSWKTHHVSANPISTSIDLIKKVFYY